MDIIANHGVVLNVWDRPKLCHAFRVGGMARNGVINFDDFQRVCLLTAIDKIKSTAQACTQAVQAAQAALGAPAGTSTTKTEADSVTTGTGTGGPSVSALSAVGGHFEEGRGETRSR